MSTEAPVEAHVVVRTTRFADDLAALLDDLGFRVELIFPADDPRTAVVSGHGTRLRLEAATSDGPVEIALAGAGSEVDRVLPGGSRVVSTPAPSGFDLPHSRPSLVIVHDEGESGVGRAGMRYRDLLPGRWGGSFISSHITIPDGGPVPDYVHYHRIRFQMIFVKAGWVRVVYEDQGPPFVMNAGDCVLQPPEIRHRVLESSPGLEVVEIGCPAEHHTLADWSLPLPTAHVHSDRDFDGQRFVRHVAATATYSPWRLAGWEYRDTGIGVATGGLAGARVARPVPASTSASPAGSDTIAHDTEFSQLVVLRGTVTFTADDADAVALADGDAVAIPGGRRYRLDDPSDDCELLDVTLPDAVTPI